MFKRAFTASGEGSPELPRSPSQCCALPPPPPSGAAEATEAQPVIWSLRTDPNPQNPMAHMPLLHRHPTQSVINGGSFSAQNGPEGQPSGRLSGTRRRWMADGLRVFSAAETTF